MTMEHDHFVGAMWRDGLALADAAERAGLDAAVPACPGWAVRDLVWHMGEVHDFWRTIVERGWDDPNQYEQPERPPDDALLAWFRQGVDAIVTAFTNADPRAPAWSWAPRGGSTAWVVRRMAHETAVHRWDAESATGEAGPVDAELASDGIDEYLEHFTDGAAEGAAPLGGSVHLHCTDVPGEWLVTEPDAGGRLDVRREHAKGDVAVRGPASDLLLALWRRRPLAGLDVFGDADVAQRFIDRTTLD
jgi:uncharacterized protein (TIGR03083 family)